MKNSRVVKTNFIISIILIIGFSLTALLGYRANYEASLTSIEQVSLLTADGIYHEISSLFIRPVNVSLTMAHDSFLQDHLAAEAQHLEDAAFLATTQNYLRGYQKRYEYDSVFLVSAATGRYYNFNGLDRVLTEGDPENGWYYNLLESPDEYSIVVDNDQVAGAENAITVFVNGKVTNAAGQTAGIVGVGVRIESLQTLLQSYEREFGVHAYLLNGNGTIEVSTSHTGYEQVDWFALSGNAVSREEILGWQDAQNSHSLWTGGTSRTDARNYVVTCYIPELSWHLVVEQDTGPLLAQMRWHLAEAFLLIAVVLAAVLIIVASVIHKFNDQITALTLEHQQMFQKATEQLYDNIYELNITKNQAEGKRTADYFSSLGAKDLPYDQALRVIAEKQIKEEHRAGYLSTFSPENVLREYEEGNDHLQYDFLISQDGMHYYWMRIDAHIFYSSEDRSVHMFTYRKNIDAEKRKEQQIRKEAQTDGMTGLLTKEATRRAIIHLLQEDPHGHYAFFMLDIDNFKQANDQFGHAFGDRCIRTFAELLRRHFGTTDVVGRVGGDEFVVFSAAHSRAWAVDNARELSSALQTVCQAQTACWSMSASIGVALCPDDGVTFEALYQKADAALYETKRRGKGGFTVSGETPKTS